MLGLYKKFNASGGNEGRYSELVCIIDAKNNWKEVPAAIQKDLQDGKYFHQWIEYQEFKF